MKALAAFVLVPLMVAGADALAQADTQRLQLSVCAMLPPAERLECLDKLPIGPNAVPPNPAATPAAEVPRPSPAAAPATETPPPKPTETVAPAAEAPPSGETWVVSQTTSPFDYSPIAIATASTSSTPTGVPLQLSIQCRGGGTELVLLSAPIKPRGEGYAPVMVPALR